MKFNSHKFLRTSKDKESIHSLPFEYDPTPLNENEGYFFTRGMELSMTINELAKAVFVNAKNHGFYDQIDNLLQHHHLNKQEKDFIRHLWYSNRLLLIISEICEGFEGMRHGNMSSKPKSNGLVEELADAQIRIADFTEDLKQEPHDFTDFEEVVLQKHLYNKSRPFMHGGKKS